MHAASDPKFLARFENCIYFFFLRVRHMAGGLNDVDIISYPLFVHIISTIRLGSHDIYGWVLYHMRPSTECDT